MKDILCILVLFNTELEYSDSITTLNRELEMLDISLDVFVYDNSPIPTYQKSSFVYKQMNITYISDTLNPGVSKAYNMGANYAHDIGKKWLLLLDQDTSFPENTLRSYLEVKENPDNSADIIAPTLQFGKSIYSPCGYHWYRTTKCKCVSGLNSFKGITLLNSGLLITLSLFKAVGGYNEKISLDFSDTCFIERVKRTVCEFHLIPITCLHNLSSNETDLQVIRLRYKFYLLGAFAYSDESENRFLVMVWVFLRTLKLTFKYIDIYYLKSFFKIIKD